MSWLTVAMDRFRQLEAANNRIKELNRENEVLAKMVEERDRRIELLDKRIKEWIGETA